jgi:hypothetical protein
MVVFVFVVHPGLGRAQGTDAERIRQLEEQLRLIRQEIDSLKQNRAKQEDVQQMQQQLNVLQEERTKEQGMMTQKPGAKFPFGIDFGASITVRYDITEVEDPEDIRLEDNEVEGFRTRDRFWARFHPDGPVNAGIRLSTGGNNPTSPFVRMGDVFRTDSFNLDQFYLYRANS